MIIWSGQGRFAGIIFLASVGIMFLFKLEEEKAFLFGSILAAPLIWFIGKAANKPEEKTNYKTGQKYIYKPNHSMFWIPMQYWAFIYVMATALFYFG